MKKQRTKPASAICVLMVAICSLAVTAWAPGQYGAAAQHITRMVPDGADPLEGTTPEAYGSRSTRVRVYLPYVCSQDPERWDPKGMIAFERQAEGSEFHDVYLMYNDGSRLENLTSFSADDGAPTWSPDGNFIAFSSNRVGNESQAIFKIDLRSRQVAQLTSGEFKDRWPTWSPDGTEIAFMRRLFTNGHANGEIFVMNADGTDQRNITNYEWGDDYPAWSRDGAWIAFTSERNWGGRDLWLVRPDGTDPRIVRRTDFQAELYPTWSPDGQIYHTFSPNKGDGFLFRIRPDGAGAAQVFDDSFKRYIASFAPDGQCFVFYGFMGGPDKEVWKWCNGYGAPQNLTSNEGISDEFCAWSPVP